MKRWLFVMGFAALIVFAALGFDGGRSASFSLSPPELTLDQLRASITDSLEERQTDISFEYGGNREELSEQIGSLLKEAFAEDDYTAYNVESYLYTIRTWGTSAKIKLSVTYRESALETAAVDERIRQTLPAILEGAATDRQKARAIHDWIVTHVAYDTSLQRYTAYDALMSGSAVCQGYTLLAHRMMAFAGLESKIVEGTVASGSHVWNLVHIDGEWYHMDATWDDPVPDRPGIAGETYFLKTDAEMKRDHQWNSL
jgi:transglutaminase-like putative cysteine protease